MGNQSGKIIDLIREKIIECLYGNGPPFTFKTDSEIRNYLSKVFKELKLEVSNPSVMRRKALENLEKIGFVYRDLVRRGREEKYKITDAGVTWYLLLKEKSKSEVFTREIGEMIGKIISRPSLSIFYVPYIGMKPGQLLPNVKWLLEDQYYPALIIPVINKPLDDTTKVMYEYQKYLCNEFKRKVQKMATSMLVPPSYFSEPYEVNTIDFYECLKDLVKLFAIFPNTREKCLIYVDITDCPKIFMNAMHLITSFYHNIFLVFMPYPKPREKIITKEELQRRYGDPFKEIKSPEKPAILRPPVFKE